MPAASPCAGGRRMCGCAATPSSVASTPRTRTAGSPRATPTIHRPVRPHPAPETVRRTPPAGYTAGFANAPDVACRTPENGEAQCVSIGPNGPIQMAALTNSAGVTARQRATAGVSSLSSRWGRGDMPERVTALLRNNPQNWGPFVVASLAATSPRHGRPIYISSRWGRRPGNAVRNVSITEFIARRCADSACRADTVTIHVTGQAVRIVLDPAVANTWNGGNTSTGGSADASDTLTPDNTPTRNALSTFAPAPRPTAHRSEVMARTESTTRGNASKVVGLPTRDNTVWWWEWHWRLSPCALA